MRTLDGDRETGQIDEPSIEVGQDLARWDADEDSAKWRTHNPLDRRASANLRLPGSGWQAHKNTRRIPTLPIATEF
jgi:hypothetical protein